MCAYQLAEGIYIPIPEFIPDVKILVKQVDGAHGNR
jgi:hypothetical protein